MEIWQDEIFGLFFDFGIGGLILLIAPLYYSFRLSNTSKNRGSLIEGADAVGADWYRASLQKFLWWTAKICDDMGRGKDGNTPAWSAKSFGFCLRLSFIYVIIFATLTWALSDGGSVASSLLGLDNDAAVWRKRVSLFFVVIFLIQILLVTLLQDKRDMIGVIIC